MSDIAITFAIIGAIVVLFVWGRLPVEIVALGAAGYRFGDYWKLGSVVMAVFFVVGVFVVPVFWSF